MSTVTAAKSRIIEILPERVREEYVALGKEADSVERQIEALETQRRSITARRQALTEQAISEATSDRDLAALRHSSHAAYSLFIDRVRAIHPRMSGIINFVADGAAGNEAPYLGAEVRLSSSYGEERLSVEDAPSIAAALRTFAERFVDEVPDFGPHSDMVAVLFTGGGVSTGARDLSLHFEPGSNRSVLRIIERFSETRPFSGTLEETLAATITQSLKWVAEDDHDN